MDDLLRVISENETLIYVLSGLVALVFAGRLLRSLRELSKTQFGLEREHVQAGMNANVAILAIAVLFAAVTFVMATFVTPSVPGLYAAATPTLNPLTTATSTLPVAVPTVETDVVSAAIAAQNQIVAEGCIAGQIEWTFPAAGEEISGTVELRGTVNVDNLGFYKYEFSQPGSDTWQPIAAGDGVRRDEPLGGQWNTTQLVPGDYLLRLVVADNQNTIYPACVISIRIVAPKEDQ